jgi:hypothetical protein
MNLLDEKSWFSSDLMTIGSVRKDLACIQASAKAGFCDTPKWSDDADDGVQSKLRARFYERLKGLRDPAYRRGAFVLSWNYCQWLMELG